MHICKRFEDDIVEAALTGKTPSELSAHLERCEACRKALQAMSPAAQGLARLREVDAPDPRAEVWRRLDLPARRNWAPFAIAAAVTCIIVAVMLARGYVTPRTPPAPGALVARQPAASAPSQPEPMKRAARVSRPQIVSEQRDPEQHSVAGSAGHRRQVASRVRRPEGPPPPTPASEDAAAELPAPEVVEAVAVWTPAPLDEGPAVSCRQFTVLLTVDPDRLRLPALSPDPTYQALAVPTVRYERDAPIFAPAALGS